MKKIKLLTSLVGLTGLSMGLVPMISGCSRSNPKSNVELDESVIKQKISVKSENIVKGKESTIEFNLPIGKKIFKITLKIGDNEVTEANVTIEGNNVTIEGNKVTIPASEMTAGKVIVKKIVLVEQPVDFLRCEWSEINTWCAILENKKIDEAEFCAHFLNGTTPITSMEDFVGLERTIQINNKDHVIRVIGKQHDVIVEDGKATNKKAALTFEMVTLLSDNDGNKMTSKWDTTNHYDYTNSQLRKNLTGQGKTASVLWYGSEGAIPSPETKTALGMLPPELQNSIKTVNKEVAISTDSGKSFNTTKYNDMLFPLTYTEMAQSSSPWVKAEGTAYKYWTDHNTDNDRKKKDAAGSLCSYWLVSPNTHEKWAWSWYVHSDGYMDNSAVDNIFGVSFGFCI